MDSGKTPRTKENWKKNSVSLRDGQAQAQILSLHERHIGKINGAPEGEATENSHGLGIFPPEDYVNSASRELIIKDLILKI